MKTLQAEIEYILGEMERTNGFSRAEWVNRIIEVLPTWQPIETAPRDGENILIWTGIDVYKAKWIDSYLDPGFEHDTYGCWVVFDCNDSFYSEVVSRNAVKLWMKISYPPIPYLN